MPREARGALRVSPAVVAGALSTLVLMAVYLRTAAPDLTAWDASEFMTAAHTLGIPHPPGTPLWVLLGNCATKFFRGAGPARSVTLLSVFASALAGGVGAAMLTRSLGSVAAFAAAVSAGTMMSVWANATETEVYGVALLLSLVLLAAGQHAGGQFRNDDEQRRWRRVIAFCAGLAVPLHLSVLVALPAAIAFAWRPPAPRFREILVFAVLFLLGASAVGALPLLAAQAPALDSGHPITWQATLDVLQRKQYAVGGLWPRAAPLWLQLGNVFEWADWQIAYGVHPEPAPTLARTAITGGWVVLAAIGLRDVWRRDVRVARALTVLLVCGSFGVAVWLNMRAGPSYGAAVLPVGAEHEARERDYFFVLGFWAWGVFAVAGMSAIARRLAERWHGGRWRLAVSLPFVCALVPLFANRGVMDRTREPVATLPRTVARALLESVPQRGVLYTAGDNDSFPLWYLQQVEGVRTDVLVVTVPLLAAQWYREQLHRRDAMFPSGEFEAWGGLAVALRSTAAEATRAGRAVRVSVLLGASERRLIDPQAGWALEGVVYSPTRDSPAGGVVLLPLVLTRASERVPRGALAPLPIGVDPGVRQLQRMLRCTQVTNLADTLLVAHCNAS